MCRLTLTLLSLLFGLVSFGQNLVPNPSFEFYTSCPDHFSQIDLAEPWISPASTFADMSTDVFNVCSEIGDELACWSCVPDNFGGTQTPHTGDGYAGFFCYLPFSSPMTFTVNECLQTQLETPLVFGEEYLVSFWINLSDISTVAIDNFDVYFSEEQVQTTITITWEPSFTTTAGEFFTDKDDWMEISFTYIAEGGEEYMTIGNFDHYFYVPTTPVNGGGFGESAYYYVDDVSVTVADPEPIVYLEGTDSLCLGESTTITAFNADSWSWSTVFEPDVVISTDSVLTVTPEVTTMYFFDNGIETTTFFVTVFPLPEVDLGEDQNLCMGDELTLENIVVLDNYTWQDGSSDSIFEVNDSGLYWLMASNENCSNADSVWVEFHDSPQVDLGEDKYPCFGDPVNLEIEDGESYEILWNTGSEESAITIEQDGIYGFEAFDGFCNFSDSIAVVYVDCEMVYELPNIFTPDGSGTNDKYTPIQIKNIVASDCKIYSRWGDLVYETDTITIEWDGKDGAGNEVAEGTYYYVVVITDTLGIEYSRSGDITLLRR